MGHDVNLIIVAGGRGTRLGGATPKQFLPLAGEAILVHTARCFVGTPDLARVVVVAAPEEFSRCETLLAPLELPLRMATAGPERQQSVASGVEAVDPSCAIVLVHDAVRPLVRPAQIAACIAAAREVGAALLATPVADTVKRVADGKVTETVPRADLWLAQTPQAFRVDVLRRAHEAARREAIAVTDDAALVERLGLPVAIVASDPRNRKLTTVEDLAWAESVLIGSTVRDRT
jgi:2-C-methyl-D-erythritol 4-phosphate cytidylyltransferase